MNKTTKFVYTFVGDRITYTSKEYDTKEELLNDIASGLIYEATISGKHSVVEKTTKETPVSVWESKGAVYNKIGAPQVRV